MKKLYFFLIYSLFFVSGLYAGETDYTQGLSIWLILPILCRGMPCGMGEDRNCGKVVINRKQQEMQVIIRILLGNRNHYR